jgi:ectoine hydroxylase-related dioxygenase (phytanoyl-CoA dioxygenase family)
VGECHRDADYGHPAGETTFWLPLTPAWLTNSVWLESPPESGRYVPVTAGPGEVVTFDAVHIRHGNCVNRTGHVRVSFDFRCLPTRTYRPSEERSINAGLRFAPGEYYARRVIQ